jgi:hypothetical protein
LCSVAGVASAQTSTDVGEVGIPGSATQSGGTWTVSGSGANIWGTSDSFQFVHVTSSVTSAIEARVVDLQNTDAFAKAGVMLRASTAAGAATIVLDVRPNGAVEYMARHVDGSPIEFIRGCPAGCVTFPVSLQLNWQNGRISPWISQDGVHWHRFDSDFSFIAMTSTPQAGLAVTSRDQNQLTTAHFTKVNFAAFPPAGWNSVDVGAVGQTGSASETNGVWTVAGAGSNIWGTSDSFHYVYRGTLDTMRSLTVRIDDMQNTHAFAKAGLMVRTGLGPDAATVILDVNPSGNVEFMARHDTGGEMQYLGGTTVTFPVQLTLSNSGGSGLAVSLVASVSHAGGTWNQDAGGGLEVAPSYVAGLAVTSIDPNRLNTVHADRLSLDAIPIEIGDVGIAGNGAVDLTQPNNPITIEAAGANVWGAADSFDFVPFGRLAMIAYRVVRLTAADPFAKAGVMFRDGLASNAVNVIFDVKPDGDVEFMARRCAGCNTEYLGGTHITLPTYLILERSGITFTASVSTTDVAHRTPIGSVDLSMTDPQAGLAVTSRDPTAIATAVFDSPPQ